MVAPSGFGPQAQQSIEVALEMLKEFRYAEACVFLYHLNKWHVEEWGYVKDHLLGNMNSPGDLSMLATVLECSTKSELSCCNAVIPGLSLYTRTKEDLELFD